MRKRYVLAAGAALAMIGTAGVLYAETPETQDARPAQGDHAAITLPTGDVVKVTPQGTVGVSPAEGRENTGFFRVPGDDIIMVPTDHAEELKAGKEDPRRYNVSALLKAGVTDAAEATESQLDDREYRGLAPASDEQPEPSAEAQEVTVTIKDADGEVPAYDWVLWSDLEDDEKADMIEFDDNGVGTVELDPGSYDLAILFGDSDPEDGGVGGDAYTGISTFTVKDEPVELTLDGGEGEAVSASADNDEADIVSEKLDVGAPDANLAVHTIVGGNTDHYVLPSETGGTTDIEFHYGATLATGGDAADPAIYNLTFVEEQGIPDDLAFTASDSDLAAVDTELESLGSDTDDGFYCMTNIIEGFATEFINCWETQLTLPQNPTVYYTPGAPQWFGFSGIGTDEDFLMFETYNRQFDEAGDAGSEAPHSAPFTVGSSALGFHRDPYGLDIRPSANESFHPDTSGYSAGYTSTSTLHDEDGEIGRYSGPLGEFKGFELDPEVEGRVSVELEAEYQGEFTPIATASKASWEFDIPAADEDEYLPVNVSSVHLDAEDVKNGAAEAGAELPVTLEYRAHPGAGQGELEDLTFEVSYDEGESWDEVDTDRDGNTATATLQSPEDAESVSVRFTATDDLGGKVEQETLRSFLLK